MTEVDRAFSRVVRNQDDSTGGGEGYCSWGEGREKALEGFHYEGEVWRGVWSWRREGCEHELGQFFQKKADPRAPYVVQTK